MRRLSLTALLLSTLLIGACSDGAQSDRGGGGRKGGFPGKSSSAEPDRRLLVEVAVAEAGDVADYLETAGTIESEAQADIGAETSGVVTQIHAEEGDTVKRGQLLAVIENPSLDAGADRALIELERAQQDLERSKTLHGKGAISDSELRQAEIAYRTAKASADEARRTRGFTRLTSPIDGTVAVRDIRVGELATGRAFQVVDLDRLRVIVQLPEKDLARIREGQPVRLSSAYDDGASASGTVARVSPVVEAASGTVRVTVSVDPGQTALRPGQFVKVRIEVDRHSGVLTIPRRALVWEDGDPISWLVADAPPPEEEPPGEEGEEGTEEEAGEGGGWFSGWFGSGDEDAAKEGEEGGAEGAEGEEKAPPVEIPRRVVQRRDLEIGFMDPDRVEVVSGLAAGEPVVVVGNANLRDGAAVRLPEDPPPDTSAREDEGAGGKGGGKGRGRRG